jgi:hypothetical protein
LSKWHRDCDKAKEPRVGLLDKRVQQYAEYLKESGRGSLAFVFGQDTDTLPGSKLQKPNRDFDKTKMFKNRTHQIEGQINQNERRNERIIKNLLDGLDYSSTRQDSDHEAEDVPTDPCIAALTGGKRLPRGTVINNVIESNNKYVRLVDNRRFRVIEKAHKDFASKARAFCNEIV